MADKPDSAVKELDQLYNQAKTGRSWLEPEWIMNLAFFNNSQWMAFNGRQLFKPTLGPNRITVVDNRITGCVRTEIAKLTKNRPVFTVVPGSADDEDVNAANLGEQVMRYLWRHLKAQEVTGDALLWSRICGAGFVKVYWDSTIGDSTEVLVFSGTNQVLKGAQGEPMRPGMIPGTEQPGPQRDAALAQFATGLGQEPTAIRVKRISRGDVKLEVRSPFQILVDPLTDVFDEAEWVIEESVKSREYVKRRYDEDLQPDTPANPGMVEVKLGGFSPTGSPVKGIKVREFWAGPSSTYPGGRRVVWAQGRVLQEDRNPFDTLPYVMYSGIPTPGRLWPMSIVELLRGPQTELNKVKSQMAENRNRVGNPTVIASMQAVRDPEKFANDLTRPGGISWIDDVGSPNAVPKFLEPPQIPPWVTDEVTRIEESIQEISGQHEVSSAQVPPGVTAASAINLLQEADDTRLGPAVTDYENQTAKLGQKVLDLVANFYTDQRVIRISGDNGAWQIFPFRGAMLKGNTHVQVQTGSAFPQSKAAKQAAVQEMLTFFVQSGNPPKGRQLTQFLQDWDVGGLEHLIDAWSKDETQVNRENVQLAQGEQLPINDFDNDEIHIEAHEDFQKGQQYQTLPPEIKQLFEGHVLQHRQRLAQQQQAELAAQAQAQGQPSPQQQGQQLQMEVQGQAQQQQGQAQQQGLQLAQGEQQQRQSEETHGASQASTQAQQRQAEEKHQQGLRHAEELHQARLRAQQSQSRQQGDNRGRRAA